MANSARIDELKKKFDENPRRYFASLANEYRKAGDLDQALFICQEYLPQQPAHMSGHIVYAQTLYDLARYPEAKAEFEAALTLDPENLIALRHLGDIARQNGEFREARSWYQRVLEVDPRNTEIVDVLASIRTTPMASFAPIVVPPTPLSTPVTPAPSAPPVPEHMPAPEATRETETAAHEELLDLDTLTIGETPLSTAAASSDARASSPEGMTPAGEPVATQATGGGEADAEAFEADALAMAADGAPDIELATDLNLGLIGDEAPPTPADIEADRLEGLRTYEAGVLEKPAEPIEKNLETEPFYDVLHGDARSTPPAAATPVESLVDHEEGATFNVGDWSTPPEGVSTPSEPQTGTVTSEGAAHEESPATPARQPTPPASSEIFVTETMAELYLQQGHLDSARDIYQKLLEQRPEDPTIGERLRAVEAQLAGFAESAATIDDAISPAVEAGPTIREFLLTLVANGGGVRAGNGAAGRGEHEMSSSEAPGGSIDALFGGSGASESDSAAASTLADAFSETETETGLLQGLPAHRATNELSLDQVFKATTPARTEAQPDGFSFDQFFAGETNATPPNPSPNSSAPAAEGTDDIAQFNAWLNGLKKT